MAWFQNYYQCDDCDKKWADEWSCMVNDDCPFCDARHMEPYDADDLTFLVIERANAYVVLESPEPAEDSPDYVAVAEFPTRELAKAYVTAAAR